LRNSQLVRSQRELEPLAIRAHPLVFGVVLFLSSELMLFAAMFAAYYDLRSLSGVWPPTGVRLDLLWSTIGTVLLGLSSGTVLLVGHALNRRRVRATRLWLGATIALGAAFLVIAFRGWSTANFRIDSNAYGSLFYMMTGFHAAHVIVGLILLSALLLGAREPAFIGDRRAGAEGIMYYWHFVFIVWVGIWATIYLVR
jgi:cytochrome c oxidase subunit 3